MNDDDLYNEQEVGEKIKQQGQNVYSTAQDLNNKYNQINSIKERISNSKKANSVSNAEKEVENIPKEKAGLKKKEGLKKDKDLDSTKIAAKNSLSKASTDATTTSSKGGIRSGLSKLLKGGSKSAGKAGAKAAATTAGKAALSTSIKTFILANPITLIVIGCILGLIFIILLFLFIKINVVDTVGANYDVSPDELTSTYAGENIEIGDKESMDEAFSKTDESLFESIGSWISKVFGGDAQYNVEKLISKSVKRVKKTTNLSNVTPGLAISTFINIYENNTYDENADSNTENDVITSFDMLWDLINTANADSLNVEDTMMNNYLHYTYSNNAESDSTSVDRYVESDEKYKVFLRYGQEAANKYEENINILLAYNSNTGSAIQLPNGMSYSEMENYIESMEDGTISDGDFSYRNGLIFKEYDVFNESGYEYNRNTEQDIEIIISDIFAREQSVNELLGYYNKQSGNDYSGDINTSWPFFADGVHANASGNFACRIHPIYNRGDFHAGVDLGVPGDSIVTSLLDGVVTANNVSACGCGTVEVTAEVPNTLKKRSVVMRFVHLAPETMLDVGTEVKRNNSLDSYLGESSNATVVGNINLYPLEGYTCKDNCSTGPHLHLEVLDKETLRFYNPSEFVSNFLQGNFDYETNTTFTYPAENYDSTCG